MILRKRTWILLALMAINAAVNESVKNDSTGSKNGNKLNLPSFTDILEVKHSIEGRIRLKIKVLMNNEVIGNMLKEQLEKISVISRFEINILLGTVLIEFDSSKVDALTIQGAVMKLLGVDEELSEGRNGKLRLKAEEGVSAINSGIYDFTKGYLDLKSLFLMIFITGAVYDYRKIGWGNPGCATLLWWGASLL